MSCEQFVVTRRGHAGMERLIEMSHWMERNFGRSTYDQQGWTVDFYDQTDNWAVFNIYNPTWAFWFRGRWPDALTPDQAEEIKRNNPYEYAQY